MTIGHNSTNQQLLSFIQRIEKLDEERAAIASDIKEVKAEAKSAGFDVGIINQLLKIRKMDEADRQERETLLASYMAAIGMLAGTPLGDAGLRDVA